MAEFCETNMLVFKISECLAHLQCQLYKAVCASCLHSTHGALGLGGQLVVCFGPCAEMLLCPENITKRACTKTENAVLIKGQRTKACSCWPVFVMDASGSQKCALPLLFRVSVSLMHWQLLCWLLSLKINGFLFNLWQ